MKKYNFCVKSTVIAGLLLSSGVVMANSEKTDNALTGNQCRFTELSTEATKTTDVMIELLSKLETFELGKKVFGGEKGLVALGSGFSQKAPGSTRDFLPGLDTQTPPAPANKLSLDPVDKIRTEIIKFIDKPDLARTNMEKVEANIHFTINHKKEIVVLTIDTDDSSIDQFLKGRLNYKKLSSPMNGGGRYTLKVTIKNG